MQSYGSGVVTYLYYYLMKWAYFRAKVRFENILCFFPEVTKMTLAESKIEVHHFLAFPP